MPQPAYVNVFDQMTTAQVADVVSGAATLNVTTAVQAACSLGKAIYFPRGTYLISKAQQLGGWASQAGITLIFEGAIFKFDPSESWAGTTPWACFRFTTSTDIDIQGHVTFIGKVVTTDFSAGTFAGPHALFFEQGCKRVKIGTVFGKGIGQPVQFDRTPLLMADYVASVGAAGSGYTTGDTLTATGFSGTGWVAPTFTVGAVNAAGGITALPAVANAGSFVPTSAPVLSLTDDGISVTGGTGTGAKLNVQFRDGNEDTLNESIVIDCIEAGTCWYGLSFVYGCRGVVVDRLHCNNVYRALIAYGGVDDLQINCTFRNHWGDGFVLGSGMGLGFSDVRANVRVLPQVDLGLHNASKIRISWENKFPAVFKGLELRVACDYGTAAGRGGSLIEIDKEDSKGRGRVFHDLNVSGYVTGYQDEDSGLGPAYVIGTNLNPTWSSLDDIGEDFEFNVDIRSASAITFDATVKPVLYSGRYMPGDGLIKVATNTWRGDGSPESQVAAPMGSLYQRRNGGTGTSLYVKESGTGNTGWVAK